MPAIAKFLAAFRRSLHPVRHLPFSLACTKLLGSGWWEWGKVSRLRLLPRLGPLPFDPGSDEVLIPNGRYLFAYKRLACDILLGDSAIPFLSGRAHSL